MLRTLRRAANAMVASVVWGVLFALSSCFVLLVMMLALVQRRKPAES